MRQFEQYMLRGDDLDMPLVDHCGYERPSWTNRLGKHAHRGPEIIFMLEGTITWDFSEGDPVLQRGGMFHLLGPNISHWPRNEKRTPSRIVWLVCNPLSDNILKHTTLDLPMLKDIFDMISKNSARLYKMNSRLEQTVKYFAEQARVCRLNPAQTNITIFRSLVCQLLVEVYERISDPAQASEHYAISAAKAFLEENYQREVTMEELTKYLGYSSTWILKLFTREVGVPPAQYLQRYRIKKAKEILLNEDLTITEAALQCGFGSSQYFSQVFKKYTGQTPSEFIKQKRIASI